MLTKLPVWVVDDVASVREEVAPWVDATPEQLWRATESCARDALWTARASGMLAEVLAYEEPLPASTQAALERLRRRGPR